MNNSSWNSLLDPFSIIRHFASKHELILELTKREILQQYRGASLGILWSILNPLFMLAIYTFVFSVILNAKWEMPEQDKGGLSYFAFMLFAGLIPYTLFKDVAGQASELIARCPNYVRKVRFPLEVLPLVLVISAWIHSLISIALLVAAMGIVLGTASSSLFLLPLAYLPLLFFCLGFGWFLAALGVYVKDIGQVAGVALQMLFFLSPVVYPDSAVPGQFRWILHLNPLSSIIYDFRRVLIWDASIAWAPWLRWLILSILFAWVGYIWFMKTRKGFANVI